MTNDEIIININLNRESTFINFENFKWGKESVEEYVIMKKVLLNPEYNFNKRSPGDKIDLVRVCELEFIKKNWKDISGLSEPTFDSYITKFDFNTLEKILNLLSAIKHLFQPYFKLTKAWADEDTNITLKLLFEASSEGSSSKQEDIGIRLKVVQETSKIRNEVKKNGLLYDNSNELQLRIGDSLIFYIQTKR